MEKAVLNQINEMTDQSALSRHEYLNPDFIPNHVDEDFCRKHAASGLAYDVLALIRTAQFAMENETSGVDLDKRGIAATLEIAGNMAFDLISRCETMEIAKGAGEAKTVTPYVTPDQKCMRAKSQEVS